MKKLFIALIIGLAAVSAASADDLYKVTLHSQKDADILQAAELDVLLNVPNGYVVLVESHNSQALIASGLDLELLASGIRCDQIAMDGRFDRKNAEIFEVLFEEGRLRLLLADKDRIALASGQVEVFPIPERDIPIRYETPSRLPLPELTVSTLDEIQDFIAQVEQDSLEAYVLRLEAFYRRLTGTDSNYAARDYIASKFTEFGYDSVVIDPFIGSQLWDRTPCQSYNVMAYKLGSVYPDQQIIIGGHFDAVPDCPGADDNASGTAAVMECARILKDYDNKMTMIFIAFDSEESMLWGSYHYVEGAIERDDDIVLMINADMIAHYQNSDSANLYTGSETAYANLWDQLSNTYVGINAHLAGSTASDHFPFQQAGYDVIFVQEGRFSTKYHTASDSTTYLNFEYMTRMVQATLATMYAVDQCPPPIHLVSLQEPGDGQSQIVNWLPIDLPVIDHYRVCWYPTSSPSSVSGVDVASTESSYLVEGLADGQEYAFFVQAYDDQDHTSYAFDRAYATPNSVPAAPPGLTAMPSREAVKVSWTVVNTELDFDHCDIIRDGVIIASTNDTFYIDDDPSLGSDMHYYYVTAVDTDDIQSDTVGIAPVWSKAATLTPSRILAVNRSSRHPVDLVDEVATGEFMRQALDGYDFDYFSDTAATTCIINCRRVSLFDMVDYGLLVIGAETAGWDDIGCAPYSGGILDTLAYYLSIGGKVVIFGRWGDLKGWGILDYTANPSGYSYPYYSYFHIDPRIKTTTTWPLGTTQLLCDLVGAHTNASDYPELAWDSLATLAHANANDPTFTSVGGIPGVSFISPGSDAVDVIYTYDSRVDDPLSEGQPVAWRYIGNDYAYVYFDIPLSLFEREPALTALRQAVSELVESAIPPPDEVPNSYTLSQNYPNPFNPFTRIEYSVPRTAQVEIVIYNILGQKVATLVDELKPAGIYTVDWNGADSNGKTLASGIYLYRMRTGNISESRKMLLIK